MEGFSIPEHPSILLLNARPWTYALGVRSLPEVPDAELDAVASGCDVVWLQGCWEIGAYGPEHDLADPGRRRHFESCLPGEFAEADCIGSPYAISRYSLNPALGCDADLAAFRGRLAARGCGLMLDFVPNHMARDSPWTALPGIFIESGEGPLFGRDPYSGDWTDTAQLNYWSEKCREHISQELLKVAEKCDAVRVDMAMLCCNPVIERTWGALLRQQGFDHPGAELWPLLLSRVRERFPRFLALAECYEYDEIYPRGTGVELVRQGFHAVYDKTLYDRLTEGHMDKLRGHVFGDQLLPGGHLCHFTENHDEERAAAHFGSRALAAAVASLTLPGPRMFMWGQQEGRRERLAVQLRRCRGEAADPEMQRSFGRLLQALPLCRGSWRPCPTSGEGAWRLVVWAWHCPDTWVVAAVNYTDAEAWAHVDVSGLLSGRCGSCDAVKLEDLLSGEVFERRLDELRGGEGLVLGLKPFQSHLLACR
uniref:Glycosyl hydrolase family 13 catalytic domain-containing protein n=1 Tax=Alexandrium monilatum TaxID=311494 RepID=A0A7S4T568_9DINO|mmetsp:Transcript_17395/g.52485  ORF Transcript_17395/g.52485 Transcript_17395/m.52485 type:complete len:480 (-) Transcript_17395:73-1512(-)